MDATSNTKTATLTVGNKTYDFPILSGTVGPDVIDIAKLYGQSGMFTYDPGFTSTASCQSKITYIDGDAGILEYRGYPIEQLAEHGDFLETCYLLLYGELPTKAQKEDFDSRVIHHTMVHEQMARFFQGFRPDAHPMAIMVAAGIACLWGPAHGGANEAALAMLAEIGTVDKIPDFIRRVKDKNSEVRLMGFGHRVYKNYDPRAKIMQKMCHAVLAETGHGEDPMLRVALELEKIALHDQYFIDRKLYPNVDFYSGITLKAMGFPTSMFTVLMRILDHLAPSAGSASGARWSRIRIRRSAGRASSTPASRVAITSLSSRAGNSKFFNSMLCQPDATSRVRPASLQRPFGRRNFRIVASTISAARALGGWLPVDMIASIFAKASSCRWRNGESVSASRSAGASFSG